MARKLFIDAELRGDKKVKSALKGIEKQGITSTKAIATGFATAAVAITGLVMGLRGLGRALSNTIDLYMEQEQAEARLVAGLRNVGDASDAARDSLLDQASALQSLTGVSDGLIISAQGMLTTFMLSSAEIQVLTPRLLDMAAGTAKVGEGFADIEAIALAMGKALATGAGALGRYGVILTDVQRESFNTATGLEKVKILAEILDANFAGMAAAMGDTYTGQIRKMGEAFGDFKEDIGMVLSEGILPLIAGTDSLLGKWSELDESAKRINITTGLYITGAVVLIATMGTLVIAVKALAGAFGWQSAAQLTASGTSVAHAGATGMQTAAIEAQTVATLKSVIAQNNLMVALIALGVETVDISFKEEIHGLIRQSNVLVAEELILAENRLAVSEGRAMWVNEEARLARDKSTVAIKRNTAAMILGNIAMMAAIAVIIHGVTHYIAWRQEVKRVNEALDKNRKEATFAKQEIDRLNLTINDLNETNTETKSTFDEATKALKAYLDKHPELQGELDITIDATGLLRDRNGELITTFYGLQTAIDNIDTTNVIQQFDNMISHLRDTFEAERDAPYFAFWLDFWKAGAPDPVELMELAGGGLMTAQEAQAEALRKKGREDLVSDILYYIEKNPEVIKGLGAIPGTYPWEDWISGGKIGQDIGFGTEELIIRAFRDSELWKEMIEFNKKVVISGRDKKLGPSGTKPDPIFIAFAYPDAGGGIVPMKPGMWIGNRYYTAEEMATRKESVSGLYGTQGAVIDALLNPEGWVSGGPVSDYFPIAGPAPRPGRDPYVQELIVKKAECTAAGGTWDEETQTCRIGQPDADVWAAAATQVYRGDYGAAAGGLATALFAPTLGPFAGLAGMIVGDIFSGLFAKKERPKAMRPIPVEVVNWEPVTDLLNATKTLLSRGASVGTNELNDYRIVTTMVGI